MWEWLPVAGGAGTEGLILVPVAGSARSWSPCLLWSYQQKIRSWPGPHAWEGKSNLRILARMG